MRNFEMFLNAIEYQGKVENEVFPEPFYPCFQGAWYYKVLSSHDSWLGFEGVLTLPEFEPDENRFEEVDDPKFPNGKVKKYLDTPSVYVGGSSDFETDIGFGWFHGIVNDRISTEKITFRPFWRTIFVEDGKEKNVYLGTPIEATEYYFFPGDQLKIQLICEEDNYLSFIVTLLNPTKNTNYSEKRALCKPNQRLYISKIKAPGNGIHSSTYKRVNAIDQYHNEGKPTQNTNAMAKGSIWESVYLYREINQRLVKVPFTSNRFTQMKCPNARAFMIENTDHQEIVSINPKNVLERNCL